MFDRYRLREDPLGWSVYDVWTDWLVCLGGTPLFGLDRQSACDVATALAILSDHGDNRICI